jgi:ubiquinone/menaquinone biosynthesis C-methylase UbiE
VGRMIAAMYDWAMRSTEEACLQEWRAGLVRELEGEVLEVGAGTGLNLPLYPSSVSRLVLSEPDPHMRAKLAEKAAVAGADRNIELSEATLEALPMTDESFDAVVATLVLCSVPRLDGALAEIYRVLRPGGSFLFLEHVAAENRPRRLRWQRRVEPVWKFLAGNCHLTRRTADSIVAAGFEIRDIKRESMRKAWPLVRPTIRGMAVKPAARP